MLTNTVTSIKDNLKRRFTNPFLGTFTVVYVIRNWELFYGIFNFDPNTLQKSKIEYIKSYYTSTDGIWNLVECALYTLIVLLVTYILLGIGRLLANTYEDHIIPIVNRITGNSRNVTREVYDSLQNERNEIQVRYEKEREERNRIQKERDSLGEQLVDLKTTDKSAAELANLNATNESLQSQLKAKDDQVNSLKRQSADKDEVIEKLRNVNQKPGNNDTSLESIDNLPLMIYEEIKEKKLLKLFDDVFRISSIQERTDINLNIFKYFLDNNIITASSFSQSDGKRTISLTQLGNQVFDFRLLDKFKRIKMKSEKDIYSEIINRFPSGRLAAHLLNSEIINKDEIIRELEYFTEGKDSDRRYTDEQSKIDARDFIDRLKVLKR